MDSIIKNPAALQPGSERKGVNGARQIGKCAISKAKAVEMAVWPI
jgi:hypothetical protein